MPLEWDWKPYIFAGAVVLTLLVAGIILILVWSAMRSRHEKRQMRFVEKMRMHRCKQIMVDAMSECMDILPDKILEVKQCIDEEGFK